MSAVAIDLLRGMSDIVGEESCAAAGEAIRVAPANTDQIAEVLRFANASGLVVMPVGGGTKLGWGKPVAPAIQLSLARMNALREHAWEDLTCTVEAGCSWQSMQHVLAQHGQRVALDPLWPAHATAGGVVATNDSGTLRLKYGGLRDLIIGMTVVLADGTVAKTGGKVVKNVAGYDLHKLLCGSFGTLGVIAEINFRLHPIEQTAQTWTIAAPDAMLLDAPLRALLDSQMAPSCMQVRSAEEAFALDVRIASLPECLTMHVPTIARICGSLQFQESGEDVWQARQTLFDQRESIILKAAILPSEIASTMAKLVVWGDKLQAEISVVAQATGLMTVAIDAASHAAIALIERLRSELLPTGGTVVAMQMPDAVRAEIDLWGPAPDTIGLMRAIKQRFDPNGILNPGRFVGGI